MKKLFLFALLFIVMASCKDQLKEEVISSYGNGQVECLHYFNKKNECVREVQLYENGAIKMEGEMKNGERFGEWKAYFPDGKVQSTGFFENGIRIGEAKIYHANGNLYIEGQYENGKKVGEWIYYDEQGYESSRVNY